MASDRTREQLITQFAKAIQGIISDQTNHDISVGTLEEEVRYNVLPLLDAFERETLERAAQCVRQYKLNESRAEHLNVLLETVAADLETGGKSLAAQPTPEVKK